MALRRTRRRESAFSSASCAGGSSSVLRGLLRAQRALPSVRTAQPDAARLNPGGSTLANCRSTTDGLPNRCGPIGCYKIVKWGETQGRRNKGEKNRMEQSDLKCNVLLQLVVAARTCSPAPAGVRALTDLQSSRCASPRTVYPANSCSASTTEISTTEMLYLAQNMHPFYVENIFSDAALPVLIEHCSPLKRRSATMARPADCRSLRIRGGFRPAPRRAPVPPAPGGGFSDPQSRQNSELRMIAKGAPAPPAGAFDPPGAAAALRTAARR